MFHENDSPAVRPARVCTLGEPSNSHIPASNGQQKLSQAHTTRRASPSPRRRYLFSAVAGILPAVEPGILPGGNPVWSGKALAHSRLRPGGEMPPSKIGRAHV